MIDKIKYEVVQTIVVRVSACINANWLFPQARKMTLGLNTV